MERFFNVLLASSVTSSEQAENSREGLIHSTLSYNFKKSWMGGSMIKELEWFHVALETALSKICIRR